MQFIIRNSVKEIKTMVKAFTVSGDYDRKFYLYRLNITATGDAVTMQGAKTGTCVTFDAEISEPGNISVNLVEFVDALKTIEDRPEIVVRNNRLSIIEGDFSRDVCDTDDYTAAPAYTWDDCPVVELPGKGFAEAVNAVIHCASDDESKYSMNGVNLDFGGYKGAAVVAVATDGRRAAWHEVLKGDPKLFEGVPAFTVKSKAAEFIAANAGDGVVRFTVSGSRNVSISFGPYTLECCHIVNDFPTWRRVLPDSGLVNTFTLAPEFVKETDRIARAASGKWRRVFVTVNGSGMTVSTEGASQKVRSATGIEGSFRFAVNVDFLREAVKAAGKKALRFMLPDDPGRPFLCRTAEGNGEEVIMPMNLN